jgi:hypothetical protein
MELLDRAGVALADAEDLVIGAILGGTKQAGSPN